MAPHPLPPSLQLRALREHHATSGPEAGSSQHSLLNDTGVHGLDVTGGGSSRHGPSFIFRPNPQVHKTQSHPIPTLSAAARPESLWGPAAPLDPAQPAAPALPAAPRAPTSGARQASPRWCWSRSEALDSELRLDEGREPPRSACASCRS